MSMGESGEGGAHVRPTPWRLEEEAPDDRDDSARRQKIETTLYKLIPPRNSLMPSN